MMAITWSSLHHDKSCSLGFEQPNDIIFIVDHHPTFCCLDVFKKFVQLKQLNLHTALNTEVCKEEII